MFDSEALDFLMLALRLLNLMAQVCWFGYRQADLEEPYEAPEVA